MKLKQACIYRIRPLLLWVGIGMPLTFLAISLPISLPIFLSLTSILFFLYVLFTFQKQTDLFIQFGVTRKKQYLSFFALLPICLLAALYALALSWLRMQILIAHPDAFSGAYADLLALYDESPITLSQELWSGLSYFLQGTSGLFIGYCAASILYRRKRRIHAKLVKALAVIAVIFLLYLGITLVGSWYFANTAHAAGNLFSSFFRTWVNWMLLGMWTGDTTKLIPIRYGLLSVAFASVDWLLLRDLPQRT